MTMKTSAIFCLLACSAVFVRAESVVQKDSAGIPTEIRLDLKIEVLERRPDGKLLLRAGGEWEGTAIGFEILSQARREGMGDRAAPGSEYFRSDVEIRRIGKPSDALQAIVRGVFALPEGESMFKGFEAGSYGDSRQWEKTLVVARLIDPNMQGKMMWRLDCFIDSRTKQLSLYVHRPRERE